MIFAQTKKGRLEVEMIFLIQEQNIVRHDQFKQN